MGLFGAAHGWGAKAPAKNVSDISYNNETWHTYTLPREDPKTRNHMTHPLSSADISIFQQKSATFVILRNIDKDFYFLI